MHIYRSNLHTWASIAVRNTSILIIDAKHYRFMEYMHTFGKGSYVFSEKLLSI